MANTIYLIRHGETQGGDKFNGISNHKLSEKGWAQMAKTVDPLQHKVSHIYSSPLLRCAEFAQKTANNWQQNLTIEPKLQEINFGDWENQSYQQLQKHQPQALKKYYQNPYQHPPKHGEPLAEFEQRIDTVWQQLLKRPHDNSLVICHAGVIRAILKQQLNLSFNDAFSITINHGALVQFSIQHNFVQLQQIRNL